MRIARFVPPVVLALCLSGLLAVTQDEELFELVKVKDGIYAALAKPQYKLNCNAAVIINEDDVLIVDVDVLDPTLYEEYKRASSRIVPDHGGKFIARGGQVEVLPA